MGKPSRIGTADAKIRIAALSQVKIITIRVIDSGVVGAREIMCVEVQVGIGVNDKYSTDLLDRCLKFFDFIPNGFGRRNGFPVDSFEQLLGLHSNQLHGLKDFKIMFFKQSREMPRSRFSGLGQPAVTEPCEQRK